MLHAANHVQLLRVLTDMPALAVQATLDAFVRQILTSVPHHPAYMAVLVHKVVILTLAPAAMVTVIHLLELVIPKLTSAAQIHACMPAHALIMYTLTVVCALVVGVDTIVKSTMTIACQRRARTVVHALIWWTNSRAHVPHRGQEFSAAVKWTAVLWMRMTATRGSLDAIMSVLENTSVYATLGTKLTMAARHAPTFRSVRRRHV